MTILVPWKPVVLVWGLLSGMILVSFVASSLLQGKDPFAPGSTKRRKRELRKQRNKLITHTKRLGLRVGESSALSRFVRLAFSVTSSRVYLQYFLQLLLQHDLCGRPSLASEP